MTESLHTDGDRTVLRMERRFRHPRARVWAAITEPEHLSQWFPSRAEFDPVVGSDVRFDMDGERFDGRVTEAEPGRVLAFTWGDDHLRFELHDDGDGCRLEFAHTFTDRYGAASFASGWAQCFVGLEQVLDGAPVTAASPSAEQHDAYVEQFGLDAGVVSAGPDGWRVRFERQLTAPAEVAWPVIERLADPPADHLLERDEPKLLAYSTPGGGLVRWEVGEGTGHGARLVLTESAPAAAGSADAVAAAWRATVAELARDLRG
ncbi:SRPBCC family protein [Jiangella aurantiaca]|uniref:SRPBCC family protein n=1 Tax=Jiangella aurantiaca TaxID=2530373 RepID=A0A4V2YRC8_9ACTN|nr:SRPBCC family protein [Jiangella aurantiaca]TDD65687.1 SRPBCC family protein [Jiangella aurantiaca]